MQKLQAKFKNVPKDTSLVLCSTNCQLNKEETLSVANIVLTCNNPEENQVQQLEKSHVNDAFIIANGKNQIRTKIQIIKQKRRNNRCLQLNRKGFKPSIKKEKSKVNPGDLFWIKNKAFNCKGMFNKGKYICYGNTKLKEYFKFTEVTNIFKFGSLIWN